MPDREALPWPAYPAFTDAERIERARAFSDTMQSRRSCRAFSEEPVPREVIEAALSAAGSAPSGANRQPWHFCILSSPEAKCAIRVAIEEEERMFYNHRAPSEWLEALWPLGTGADKPYLEAAPWLIAVFAQHYAEADLKQNYYVTESIGLACGLLLAALHQAGVATLVHTPTPSRILNRICRRPDHEKPVMLIVAGYPSADATIPAYALDKKTLEQITSWL